MSQALRLGQFPSDFAWGVATSSYQIEGAVGEDGRSPSVWDTFSAIDGRVLNGDTGAIACDHYHRFEEDIQLMVQLGVKHYRFSIAWPRIVPEGRGHVNEAGIDWYRRFVEVLLDHGITPHATLFHWDSPQALEDRYGSWRSREMAQDFADYAGAVVARLGDRITHWITLNEIFCFTHMGYGVKAVPPHAPGTVVDRPRDVWQTSHHALLAHGLACQAIRAASPVPCQVSWVDNWMVPVPLIETPENIEAAKKAFGGCGTNGGVIVPALTGRYDEALLQQLGPEAPVIQDGDLETIHQPLDSLGFNVYTGVYVQAAETDAGFEWVEHPPGYPRMHMPWLQVVPEAMYWGIRHMSETLGRSDLPIYITENGCAAQDALKDDAAGKKQGVLDSDRIFYLRQYLRAAQRAVAEGYPLKGYFLWSLLDNFEWAYGYDRRFGLVYVDYDQDLARIPKASFDWYRECIRQRRVV